MKKTYHGQSGLSINIFRTLHDILGFFHKFSRLLKDINSLIDDVGFQFLVFSRGSHPSHSRGKVFQGLCNFVGRRSGVISIALKRIIE